MKTGDILLVSGEGFQPEAIQKFQALEDKESAPWNHSGIIWICNGEVLVMEQVTIKDRKFLACARPRSINVYYGSKDKLLLLEHKEAVDAFIFDRVLIDNIGVPYDYWLLLHSKPKQLIGKKLGIDKWPGRKKGAERKMVCHEHTMEMWNEYCRSVGMEMYFPEGYRAAVKDMFYCDRFLHKMLKG